MDLEKVLEPLTKLVKKNNKNISLALIVLIIVLLFPIEHFTTNNIRKRIENELRIFMNNPWIRVLLAVLIYVVFLVGDIKMLSLLLYLIHHIVIHK